MRRPSVHGLGRHNFRPHRPHTKTGWGSVILIAVVVLGGLGVCTAYAQEKEHVVVVTDKDRVCDRGGQDCKYLVFTDKTTFRITDYIGRVTSSDAFGRIIPCHRYRLRTYGFRNGFTSSYENIKEATDLGPAEGCTPRR